MSLTIGLSGRIALVTGGASGIGLAIASGLREAGARVIVADIDDRALAQLPLDLEGHGLDVTDPAAAEALLERLTADGSFPHVLVNNAGAPSRTGGPPFTRQGPDDWRRCFELNVLGTVNVTRAWALSRASGSPGVVINLASVAGQRPAATDPAYSAAKAAVISFTHAAAADLAPEVRVCAVSPGVVATGFQEAVRRRAALVDERAGAEDADRFVARRARELVPLQRAQTPEEIAGLVAFLASDLAASITGQVVNVDGGLVMR